MTKAGIKKEAHQGKSLMGQKVRLFRDFIHTGLNRIVVITGSGQTILAVSAVTPKATDDLTGKFVHGLRGLSVHQFEVGSIPKDYSISAAPHFR